jgi:hypothetical protein
VGVEAELLERVAARLAEDPQHVGPVLRLIADPDHTPRRTTLSKQAQELNLQRLVSVRTELTEHALRGEQVRELLGGISRQALHQRVRAGRLLALHQANASWFPRWQFDAAGRPRAELKELLALLPRDVMAADRLMRAPVDELGGRSPAELLEAGETDLAVHYARTAGGER